ncbi:DUF6928 family protein [Micromonospora chalcea]|uniref:DUF6928 family protein n=1 Tax=Micromonospora chalcea TaxID=1874 RepID=UPI00157CD805
MGAKTALLAFTDGDIRPAMRGAGRSERAETEALVRRIHPGHVVEPADDDTLLDGVYPPDGVTYATVLAGAELYCDRRLMLDRPSELPEHLRLAGAGRRIVMHGMHSAVDWLGFAVWEDGVLVRSLSLSPDGGIQENIGEPYDFELPYWAGEHSVEPIPGWHDQDPYPLPFHPLDLGEEALRALFGFVVEGRPSPDDVDPDDVHLHGFRVTDPSGGEQAAREAAYAEALQAMGPSRTYRMGPDGTMREVSS